MRSFVFNGTVMAALLFACLGRVRGEDEVAGEDAQTAASVGGGQENSIDDIAVGGVWHNNLLYVAIKTTDSLEGPAIGGTDVVVKAFDEELEPTLISIQLGGDGNDNITAIASGSDLNEVVIVGSTNSTEEHLFGLDTPTGRMDWFIALLEQDNLTVTASYVNGSAYDDQQATAVAVAADGFVVAGWTWGAYFSQNAGKDNNGSTGYDLWVLKINQDLDPEFLWEIQLGTVAYDEPSAVVIGDNGNVYVVGTTTDSSSVLTAAEEDTVQSMFVYCFDEDGNHLWNVTDKLGVISDGSQAHGAVLSATEDELYLSGNTRGIIPGYDGNSTGTDELFVVALDVTDGATNWVWQSEANATAFGTGGIVLAEDGSPIVGGVAFGNQFNLTFTYWEEGSGDMIAAKIDTDELEVSKYFVAPAATNLTREDAFAMVKREDVDDGVFLIGSQDGDFDDEDFEPEDTSNYLVLSVELEDIPEVEEEISGEGGETPADDDEMSVLGDSDDDDKDFPFYSIGLAVFAIVAVGLLVGFKWKATQQAVKTKVVTGV